MLVLKIGIFSLLLHFFVCLYFHHRRQRVADSSEQDLKHVREMVAMCNFMLIAIASYLVGPASGHAARSFTVTWMLLAWSTRLLFHLIRRARGRHKKRAERRPEQALDRQQFLKALAWWLGQALWLTSASCPVLLTNLSSGDDVHGFWTTWDRSAVTVWVVGWIMEAVSDDQRHLFNLFLDPQYKATHFLSTGLWRWSRHPNYCGDFLHWLGLWMLSVPMHRDRCHSMLLLACSPICTLILLTKVSGIPISEAHDDRRFGRLPTYLQYKYVTSPFLPLPPSLYAQLEPGVRKWLLFETFQPKVRRVKRTLLSNSLASSPNK